MAQKGMGIQAALVDTGADFCTCPSKVTKPVGYKIRSGTPMTFMGAAAKGRAWRHYIGVSILTQDYRNVFHHLPKVPFDLIQKRNPAPLLLGRKGFLDQFAIHIDFKNQLLTLELP